MGIYDKLVDILIERRLDEAKENVWSQTSAMMDKFKKGMAKRKAKRDRTKPASSKPYKARKKALKKAYLDKVRHDELDRDYGDTSVMKQGIEK
jgi:hypothetical protein